jgi:hypothetical protein
VNELFEHPSDSQQPSRQANNAAAPRGIEKTSTGAMVVGSVLVYG